MAEQKEIDNQKLKEVKKDELVEEVKATEDIKERRKER